MYQKANYARQAIYLSGFIFFCYASRMGMINRLLVCLITSFTLIWVSKCYYYRRVVEDLGMDMTLAGQEARILLRYYFP